MKKSSLRYALLLALGFSVNQFAHALGLGPIQVNSYYGQPLNASIRLDGLSAGQAEKTIIRLAGHEAYQTRGIERLPSHEQLKFTLERSGKSYRIKVRSVNSISDPFLNFLITVNSGGSVVTREYSVFLDPDPAQALGGVSKAPKALPVQNEVAAQPVKGKAKVQPTAPVEPTERRSSMPAGNYNPAALNGDTYGPVGAGDTLYSIANATRPDDVSVKTMMNAIKRANRHAFAGNSLKVGTTLTIPSEVSGSPKFNAPAEPKRAQKTKKNSEKSAAKKAKSTPVRKKERSESEVARPVVANAVLPEKPVETQQPPEEKIVPEKITVEEVKLPPKSEPPKVETTPVEIKAEPPVVETPPPPEATLPPPVENKPVETPPPPEATLPPPVETPPTVEVTLPPPPPPVETLSEPKPIELTSTLPVETPPPPPVEKATLPAEPVAMEEEGLPAWVPWAAGGAGVGLLGLLSYFLIAKRRAKSYKGEEIEEELSDADMEEMFRQFEAEQEDFHKQQHDEGLEALEELGSKKYNVEAQLDEVDFDDFNNDDFKRDISLSKPDDEQSFDQMFANNHQDSSDDIFIDDDDTPIAATKKPTPIEDDFDLGEFSDDPFTKETLSVSKANSKVVTDDDDMDFFVDDQPSPQTAKVSELESTFEEMDFFVEEAPQLVVSVAPSPVQEDSMEFFVEDTPAPAVKPAPSKPADDFGGLDMEFFTEEKSPVVEPSVPTKHDNELDFGLDFGSEPVVETPKAETPAPTNAIDFGDFNIEEPQISVSDVTTKVVEPVTNALSFDDDLISEESAPTPVVSSKAPTKADEEAMEINLDLADSFIATGNGERAKSWLNEVLEMGTETQKARARQLLEKINNSQA